MDPRPSYKQGATLLSKEKSCNQEYVRVPAKAYMAKDPHANDEGNRDVNGKEPLGGEASDICPPVTEWNIQDKYNNAYNNKSAHEMAE
jgi:hypothetical protein